MEAGSVTLDVYPEKTRVWLLKLMAATKECIDAGGEPNTILSDATRSLSRAAKREATLSAEYERVEIVPTNGETVEFTGRLLASQDFAVADKRIEMEIWETDGGALVGVDVIDRDNGNERIKVAVAPPQDDVQAMRFAIMDLFDWSNRARSMARKLGWSLRRDLD